MKQRARQIHNNLARRAATPKGHKVHFYCYVEYSLHIISLPASALGLFTENKNKAHLETLTLKRKAQPKTLNLPEDFLFYRISKMRLQGQKVCSGEWKLQPSKNGEGYEPVFNHGANTLLS